MSFWTADEKIPVQQTRVSIPAEHGLDYKAGQKINIIIPPTIKYIQPKESYLRMDVVLKVDTDDPVKLHLDSEMGAQVLIRDISIHSGGAGAVLLEQLQNYNVLTALKYDYESNDAIRNKRALTEGSLVYDPEQRGTMGTTKTSNANTKHNPYYAPYGSDDITDTADEDWGSNPDKEGYKVVKVLLPLHTGIFQSPKVFPTLLTEGLRLEIILEDAKRVLRLPDTMHPLRRANLGVRFHSITGKDDDVNQTAGKWINDTDQSAAEATVNHLYFKRDNQQISVENCPFVIGQKVALMHQQTPFAGGASKRFPDAATADYRYVKTDKDMVIKELHFTEAQGDTSTEGGKYGLLKVVFTEAITNKDGTGTPSADDGYFLVDDSVRKSTCTTMVGATADFNPSYEVKNVEMLLQTLSMPDGYTNKLLSMMGTGGAMNYDFLSFTNYKYSQLANDRVANIRLPLNQTRAKSILCVPTDASVYTARQHICGDDGTEGNNYVAVEQGKAYPDCDMPSQYNYVEELDHTDATGQIGDIINVSNRSNLVGIWDELTDYQFFYNGQLNPSRKVECDKITRRSGVQQQPLIELEKALAMANITPLSFMKFRENACIGRALALQQGVYNTAGRDFNLQVNYQGNVSPIKPKLWMNYVAHLRRLVVQGNQVMIQV